MPRQVVLFDAESTLWQTDGTASGTFQIGGINGAYAGGLFQSPPDITALNGRVLFGGYDTSGNFDLWVSNGAGAGTYELQISTAYAGGLFSFSGNPPDLTVYNSEVLFNGYDTDGIAGL